MLSKSNTYVGLSLTEDVLKVVQIKGAGAAARVTNVFSKDVSGLADKDLHKAIQSAVSKFKSKGATPVCVVPLSMTTTKNIEIPSTDPNEISSIVNLQASRHTPFARDEIQVGYIPLGTFQSNHTRVLLVIANRNVIRRQVSVFEKAGLTVKTVLFAAEGMAKLYGDVLVTGPGGIINVGKETTDFLIVLNGKPFLSRSVPVGRVHIAAEGQSACDRLADELGKTVQSYQAEETNQPPNQYVITTNDDAANMLTSVLSSKLQWNVKAVSYEDRMQSSGAVLKKMAKHFSENSFLDVISLSAVIQSAQVNLLPEEVQLQKSVEQQGKEIFKSAILVLTIFLVIVSAIGARIYLTSAAYKKLQDGHSDRRAEVVALNDRAQSTKILKSFLESRMESLDLIKELYEKVPEEIYITGLTMDEEGVVNLQGVADMSATVYKWAAPLKESALFKKVDIKSTTAKKDRGKDASAFEITLKLKEDLEVKPEVEN